MNPLAYLGRWQRARQSAAVRRARIEGRAVCSVRRHGAQHDFAAIASSGSGWYSLFGDWPRRPIEDLPGETFRCGYDVEFISTDPRRSG